MLISKYITPLMYADPSGRFAGVLFFVGVTFLALFIGSIAVTGAEIYSNYYLSNNVAHLNIDNIKDSSIRDRVYLDECAREYVDDRYIDFTSWTGIIGIISKSFFRNIPIIGGFINKQIDKSIALIDEGAANSNTSIDNAFYTYTTYDPEMSSDENKKFFYDRVEYWRSLYEN